MGVLKPSFPPADEATWPRLPRRERLRIMTEHWVEEGFGTPIAVFYLYLLKVGVYLLGAAVVISWTPGLGGLSDLTDWWTEPVVYQKLVVYTLLFEVLGLGCGSGPLTLRFIPPVGPVLWWTRPGTIRLPPWPGRVPATAGTTRTGLDVALYLGVLAAAGWFLAQPPGDPVGHGTVGLVPGTAAIPLVVLLVLAGLRDKAIFLAARGEHYWVALFAFFLPFEQQVVAYKLLMLAIWWGAATSKLNHHFPHVVATMMSNSPMMRIRAVKRAMYRRPPGDLQPSRLAAALAHIGTAVEFLVPGVLVLGAEDPTVRLVAMGVMVVFHLHIVSMSPMGVPLEWNAFFVTSLFWLFGHYGGLTVWSVDPRLLLLLVPLAVVPFIGNVWPEKVSFLCAMRYYAGNWATSTWCFRGGAERKLEAVKRSGPLPIDQVARLYGPFGAELVVQKVLAWRSMHLAGRAINGLVSRAVADEDAVTVRDGEGVAGVLIGWNFGEGHLHDEQLIEAAQERCHFEPGECTVILLEAQPIHRQWQRYRVVDAATGLIEEGEVAVAEMLRRQPHPAEGDELPVRLLGRRPAERGAA